MYWLQSQEEEDNTDISKGYTKEYLGEIILCISKYGTLTKLTENVRNTVIINNSTAADPSSYTCKIYNFLSSIIRITPRRYAATKVAAVKIRTIAARVVLVMLFIYF